MAYVDKQDLRFRASKINNTNSMKMLIRNLVTRINRNPTVNLINIRNVFFQQLEILDNIEKRDNFIKTINAHFSILFPVETVISYPLYNEWMGDRNRKEYSDFILSEEPPLREMGGETKRPIPSAMATIPPPAMMRQESISDGVDPVWTEIMSAVFPEQEGPTPASGEDIASVFYGQKRWRPPIGTPMYIKEQLERKKTLEMANLAKKRRYARQGKPPPKPYRGGKTRKRKKMKRKKYKKRKRKRTKRKRRMKRKKTKKINFSKRSFNKL